MNQFIRYIVNNHLLANFFFIMILVGAVFAWIQTPKEEMPEFEVPWLRISAPYPGASAQDVELLVTKSIEEKIQGLPGIEKVLEDLKKQAFGQ